MKIPKATVTAVLYKSKTLASGEHPVMIRVCYNSKRRYKSTLLSGEMVERREAGGARTASAGPEHERHHRFRTDGAEKQSAGFRAAGGALLRAAHIRGFGAETSVPKNPVRPFRRAYRLFQGHPPETQHGRRLPDAAPYRRTVLAAPDRRAVRRGRRMARRVRGVPPCALCRYEHQTVFQRPESADELRLPERTAGRQSVRPLPSEPQARRADRQTGARDRRTRQPDPLLPRYILL